MSIKSGFARRRTILVWRIAAAALGFGIVFGIASPANADIANLNGTQETGIKVYGTPGLTSRRVITIELLSVICRMGDLPSMSAWLGRGSCPMLRREMLTGRGQLLRINPGVPTIHQVRSFSRWKSWVVVAAVDVDKSRGMAS